MKITKSYTVTKEYEIFGPYPAPFSTWGEFKAYRENAGRTMKNFCACFMCEKSFKEQDSVRVASCNKGNRFVCMICAKELEESWK